MIGPQIPKSVKRRRDLDQIDQGPTKRVKLNDGDQNQEVHGTMHPRNIYRYQKPDYHELSQKYEYFKDVVKRNQKTGDYYLNYKDPRANVMLTKALLKHDFNLEFDHPINHLCPPITQRLNYILWIQDLLRCTVDKSNADSQPTFHGLDIGVGASCIFPLLGIRTGEKQHEFWKFTASDIDSKSIEFAKKNVALNHFEDRITIVHQQNTKHIFKGIIDEKKESDSILYDFTVCNPPFFEHLDETGHNKLRSNPATKSELVYDDGGEVGFIQLMIKEIVTLSFYHKFKWFTSMLGKKASIKLIKQILNRKENKGGYDVFIVSTVFVQGKQMRWGLAWTYYSDIALRYNDLYSSSKVIGDHTEREKELKESKNEMLIEFMVSMNETNYDRCVVEKLKGLMQRYGISFDEDYDDNKQFIKIDNVKKNGFVFSMKWTVYSDRKDSADLNKVRLRAAIKLKFYEGDLKLFEGFVDWLRNSTARVL